MTVMTVGELLLSAREKPRQIMDGDSHEDQSTTKLLIKPLRAIFDLRVFREYDEEKRLLGTWKRDFGDDSDARQFAVRELVYKFLFVPTRRDWSHPSASLSMEISHVSIVMMFSRSRDKSSFLTHFLPLSVFCLSRRYAEEEEMVLIPTCTHRFLSTARFDNLLLLR